MNNHFSIMEDCFVKRMYRLTSLLFILLSSYTIAALPDPWQNQDIGSVGSAGSTDYTNGIFTVNGSGADIWDSVDEFHYVYQTYSGNVQIVTQVMSQTNTNGWAKAGLMVRETLGSNSKHAMMIVAPSNGSSFQYRPVTGNISYHTTPYNGLTTPCWLKLIRLGNDFNGYSSTDGTNWTLIGSTTISMTTNVYIGLCVTAHNDGQISTGIFDNVSVQTDTTPPEPDPATWAVEPHAVSSEAVTMTATTGSDPDGVQYYFEETSGNPGGNGSGWIDSPTYVDSGLEPTHTYTYVVRMKDMFGNTTGDSSAVSATTGPISDTDGNKIVNLEDFALLAQEWLQTDCQNSFWCNGADLDINGGVTISDILVMAQEWLKSYELGHFYTWAPTPPMGWNSWDCFGCTVTEDEVKANADYMAQYLKQYGWEYIVVDIQWYEPQSDKYSSNPYAYPSQPNTNIDDYGRVWPAVNKHPSSADGNGFMPLADYVHSLGLKFGIHMMRGIPRVAYDRNTPILGTPYTARDIADTGSTCSWNPDMYGVDTTKSGAQEYYNSVINLVAGWGVDYVKIDDLSQPYHQGEIEAIRNAIDQCGRPIVFSTSPGATPLSSGAHVFQHANLWRISDDFWDNWSALDAQFQRLHDWSQWNADGHYPDADMLPLGNVRARSNGWTNFTQTEQKTMMILWAIARSPLMMGGNMPNNDTYTLSLMTNSELMEVNQHSINNRSIQNNTYPIWAADVRDSNDVYLAVFNRTSTGPTPVPVILSKLGIKRCNIRNLWTHTDLGEFTDTFSPNVNAHGAELFKLTMLEAVPTTLVLNNSGFDDQVLSDGSWSAAGDVWSWSNDSGGDSFAQNLTTAQISPASQSGENTGILSQGGWIGQNLIYSDGTSVLIEANKTYEIAAWIGRRLGTEGSAAGILSVYLEDAGSNTQIAGITYDLLNQLQGVWTQQTFTLSTGVSPTGLGNTLRLGFMNSGTRGAEHWYGQVVIDSVTFTDISQ